MKFKIVSKSIFTDELRVKEVGLLEKLEDIYDKTIYSFYRRKFYYPYLDYLSGFSKRAKNCIKYFPLIWNDRDWDYHYILILLKTKLEKMIPIFENGYHTGSKKSAKEIKICVNLLERLIEDNYISLSSDEIEKRLGKTQRREIELKGGGLQLEVWNGDEEEYNKNQEKYYKIKKSIYKKWDRKKKEDTKYLFNLISRKIYTWWE